METITKHINTENKQEQAEKMLDEMILKASKSNPEKWVTYDIGMGKTFGEFIVRIYIHNQKPQSTNTYGAENTYRHHGGFFKNGQIIKPSKSFTKRFHFCPVSR